MQDNTTYRSYDWGNKVILIAEDQKINFVLLKAIFERTKATVIWAQDGEAAVESFLNTDHIDLVIMDYMMPKLNGVEATRLIKEQRQSIPVIFHSANPLEEDEDIEMMSYDDIAYFQKPVNAAQLLNKVEDLLKA
ncbi:MAG: response regulator [Bacteroidales bacterium]|nr:response regulator [Bacteroidales bacterium]